jgi:hypothetical protein
MKSILLPTYFPSLLFWKIILKNNFFWMKNSYYKKQTLRNRMFIHGANGKLMLSIPIRHSGINQKRFYDDVSIDSSSDWKKNHFKSIKICYQSSPFYEFYEDDLISFFNLDYENLYDLNLKSIKMVCNWLKIKMPEDIYNKKNKYDYKIQDLTHLSNCKRTSYLKQKKYNQTFETKNGFINNLSVIDLIFNCGPNSIDYF